MSRVWRFFLPGDERPFGYLIPETISRMPWTPEFKLDEFARTIHLAPEDRSDLATSQCYRRHEAPGERLRVLTLFRCYLNWPGERFSRPGRAVFVRPSTGP